MHLKFFVHRGLVCFMHLKYILQSTVQALRNDFLHDLELRELCVQEERQQHIRQLEWFALRRHR